MYAQGWSSLKGLQRYKHTAIVITELHTALSYSQVALPKDMDNGLPLKKDIQNYKMRITFQL